MRELVVLKSGFDTFDVLHALGLGVVIADGMDVPVRIQDVGTAFLLTSTERLSGRICSRTLQDILTIPSAGTFHLEGKLPLANLDGLLAGSFTVPGPRLISVADIKTKVSRPEVIDQGVAKATWLTSKINQSVLGPTETTSQWIQPILEEYHGAQPKVPQFQDTTKRHLSLTIPLDPGFGFSNRRPFSDGMISKKTSITMKSPRFGAALAYIGAARYLRGQRAQGSIVLLYVPAITDLIIEPRAHAGRLRSSSVSAPIARYAQWLASWNHNRETASGILVQSLHTQSSKQSISIQRDMLSYAPLNLLSARNCGAIMQHWRSILSRPRDEEAVHVDLLLDALDAFDDNALQRYLSELARHSMSQTPPGYMYNFQEITAMAKLQPNESSLIQVLERSHGTLRFGQAIRQLGEHSRSIARELIEDLDSVQNQDQLLRVLARAVQECVLAKASNNFIIVPDERDVAALLEDISRYGASTLARLLVILSVVYYPKAPGISEADLGKSGDLHPISTELGE